MKHPASLPDPKAGREAYARCVIIRLMRHFSVLLLFVLLVFHAQPAGNFALTIDNIMRGPGLVGYEPSGVRWSYDGEHLYFQWKQHTDKVIAPMDTYVVNRDGTGLRKLNDDEIKLLPPAFGDTSKDKRLTTTPMPGTSSSTTTPPAKRCS